MTKTIRGLLRSWPGLAAVFGVLLGACSAIDQPELGELYSQAAKVNDLDRNPIIVIPGILGSRLKSGEDDRVVWGSFVGSYADPRVPADVEVIGLPMAPGAALDQLQDEVEPDGVLDSIRVSLLGLPFEQGAYVHILRTLGAGGYRDEGLVTAFDIDYGTDHFTCFQFPYDWRRDIVESAKQLDAFIKAQRAYVLQEFETRYRVVSVEPKFDVVAHSMGGLVLRYYLRYGAQDLPADGSLPELTWEGAKHIDKAVLIGTPNAGSIRALRQLVRGAGFGPVVPDYPPALLGTMPSIYQLLPRPRHDPVVDAADPEMEIVDYMEPAFWQEMGWGLADPDQAEVIEALLPAVTDPAERRRIALDHQAKALARAEQFMRAIDRPATPPDGISLHLIAADSEPTAAVAAVDRTSGDFEIIDEEPGDGIVPRASALMDERQGRLWQPKVQTPIDWASVLFVFDSHQGMTRNPVFTDNILYLLLEAPA
ncbi:MAG: esterase/lipase family protein [Geminicoccaceae bacterium]